jgi:hypothetical protein
LELAKAAAAKGVGHLNLKEEGKAQDSSAESSKRPREERRRRNRGNKKEEAFAVTAAPANGKPGFKGKCYTCGQEGHVKVDCPQKPKDGATSVRKPEAVCGFCHKRDSHTEDECWEKHPEKKPEKWRKKEGGGAAYAADAEPSAPEAGPEFSPWMAWGASVQPGGDALDAFAIYIEDGPELRPTTVEQRDTTPAAGAKGEATRVAARAKEEKGRLGGPPPGFKPKGEMEAPAAGGGGQAAPTGRRRQAPEPAAEPPARATRVPPGFGEYSPNDPRYQGLTDAEQVGVRVELLDPPRTGPVTGDVVRRRDTVPAGALSAFHADVLPAEEAEAAEGATGGTGGGPPTPRRQRRWEGNRCLTGRPRSNNGAPTPAAVIMRASWTRPSSLARSRARRCSMRVTGSHGDHLTRFPKRACSMSKTSSPRWPRVEGTGDPPTMRTTHRGQTPCPRERIDAMGRGPTSTNRSAMASSAIWAESGWTRMPISQTA